MATKQMKVREKIIHKHTQNPDMSYNDIAKTLGVARSTVGNVIKNFKNTLTIERKKGSGRKAGPISKSKDKAVVASFTRNPNVSVRDVAKKINMSKSYVQKVKKRAGLQTFKVGVSPNRDEKQNTVAKTRARKLYDQWLPKFDCIVMDDETYIKADFKQIPGQEYCTAKDKKLVPDKFKKKMLSKFPKKHLIWQAICTCGKRSKIYVAEGTINQDIYEKECLQKLLLPFIRSHNVSTLFWPDLASCHYSKKVLKWYEDNGIAVVPKEANPPNCPELRPIEKYWAHLKTKLKKTNKIAKDRSDFKRRCTLASGKIPESSVYNLMAGMKRKVRLFAYGK